MTAPVLGVDPGTVTTGYGLIEPARGASHGRLVECGIIRPSRKQPPWDRLNTIYDGVIDVIERHAPSIMAVEGVFYGRNARSTITLAHARGVILLAAARFGLEVREYSPAVVKKTIVGTGRATKGQIAYMVQQLMRLKEPPSPSDAADGVALALTHVMRRRFQP